VLFLFHQKHTTMKKVELRKVKYSEIDPSQTGHRQLSANADLKKWTTIKEGFFHEWGTDIIRDNEENPVSFSIAIIEDAKTKKVYLIEPKCVQFVD
jgi:hypothetical protein